MTPTVSANRVLALLVLFTLRPATCADVCVSELCDCVERVATCSQRNLSRFHDPLEIPDYITDLDFSSNEFSSLDQLDLGHLPGGMQSLDLSSNELERIPGKAFQIFNGSLTTISLKNNFISEMDPEAFTTEQALTKLMMSFNQLSSFPDGLFDPLINLEHLDISYNQIDVLEETVFMSLQKLKILNLSFLHLGVIHPFVFDWNLTITHLDLSFNFLTSVPGKTLWHLRKTLKEIDLSGNLMQILPAGSFFGLRHLHSLQLEQLLYLERIEAYAFEDLEALETIVLRYLPNIRDINDKAFHLTEGGNGSALCPIRDFSVEFSTLPNLPEDLLLWNEVRYISLRNNRWICDCKMRWVKDSTLGNLTTHSMTCAAPFDLRGRNFHTLKKDEFRCNAVSLESTGAAVAIMLMIVLAMLFSFATVIVLVHRRNGWVLRPPRLLYDRVESPVNTITIFDRTSSSSNPFEAEVPNRELAYPQAQEA